MLNEYASTNSDLDQKILTLEGEMRVMEEKHQSELKARDENIALIQQELADLKALEAETREERDSFREDMTALSPSLLKLGRRVSATNWTRNRNRDPSRRTRGYRPSTARG
jgi:chromosome segregation ATPase